MNKTENSFWRLALEHSSEGVIIMDSKGSIQYCNSMITSMFGYEAVDLIHASINKLMEENVAKLHDQYLAESNAVLETKIIGKGRELFGVHKEGSIFPINLTVTNFEHEGKTLFLGTIRNISDFKKQERALVDAKAEAVSSNKAKTLFLSSMSHELRTPLNAVLGFSKLLITDTQEPLSQTHAECVTQIVSAGEHLLVIVNDVLELSKIETGNFELYIESIDTDSAIVEALENCEHLAQAKGIVLNYVRNTSLPWIKVDLVRFKQVLINLLSNAIKYNAPNGTVDIKVNQSSDTFLDITIADTGIGMEPGNIERIFDPFERLGQENSGIDGTGIGLSLTKKLVQLMHGTIGVKSELKKGSEFSVSFPMLKPQRKSLQQDVQIRANEVGLKNAVVLCVEDNESNRMLFRMALQDKVKATHFAVDGPSGIAEALRIKPNIIFLDFQLPGMDGVEVLKVLQEKPQTKNTPVIMLSAHALPQFIEQAMDCGASHYLTKPLNLELLTETLRKYL